jgi:hypothetical protein
LAIDQRDRPQDATELAQLLRDGAHGIGPSPPTRGFATGATRVVAPPTGATRVARPDPPTPATRAPRQVPARRPTRQEAAAAYTRQTAAERPPAQSGRAFRRIMAVLALLGVLALIVIAAVTISNSTSNTVVHYRKVIAHDAQSAVNQLTDIINKYTK